MSRQGGKLRRIDRSEFSPLEVPPLTVTANFVLPPKTSAALKIRSPQSGELNLRALASVTKFDNQNVSPPPAPPFSKRTNSSSIYQPPDAVTMPGPPEQISHPTIKSPLDIYANNYIPLWLKAVNQSSANIRPCLPLNSIDFAEYIGTFAGRGFLSCLPSVSIPPATIRPVAPRDLSTDNYDAYFIERLQNELAAQAKELQTYHLFNVHIEPINPQQQLYRLSVPGIRESSPRVDLGDTILVRPLILPYNESQAGSDARAWYDGSRQLIAPCFTGAEFHAVVWGVSNAGEYVVLRIDSYPTAYRKCNVIFAPQNHRAAPLVQSIKTIAEHLNGTLPDHSTGYEDKTRGWLRSMLFPEASAGILQHTLPRGTFDLKWIDTALNYEQQKAVNAVVLATYGRTPYLVSGPPGTGKTKTIVEATLQLMRAQPVPHLLLCAPSDPAADTLAARLAKYLQPKEMFRLNSWTRTFAEVPARLLPYCHAVNELFSLPNFVTMMSFKVVVTTCRDAALLVQAQLTNTALNHLAVQMNSIMMPSMETSNALHWTGLILDEAAQATEPEALIPLSVVAPPDTVISSPLFVMAGDEYQLGPRLSYKRGGLEMSLFERIFRRECYAGHPLSRSKGLKPLSSGMLPMAHPAFANLVRNYRSHPAILSMPSVLFYHDTLIPQQTTLTEVVRNWQGWRTSWPVLFRQNSAPDEVESILVGNGTGAGGVLNIGEANIALEYAKSLLEHSKKYGMPSNVSLQPNEIMVMSPFRAQVKTLRTTFRQAGLYDVNIGPLEAFQGLESRIVILCTTRTRLGPGKECDRFVRQDQARGLGVIDEPKRFNVAITRAKEGLIVIGDQNCLTCTEDPAWSSFIQFCQRNDCQEDDGAIAESDSRQRGATHLFLNTHVGRLEKALRYADALREVSLSRSRTRREIRTRVPSNGFSRKTLLRGNFPTNDEAMWANGVQAEEEDDLFEDVEDAVNSEQPNGVVSATEGSRRQNEEAEAGEDMLAAFDLDLAAEVEKADCITQ